MINFKKIAVLFLMLPLSASLISCSEHNSVSDYIESTENNFYKIEFITDSEDKIESQLIAEGELVDKPDIITKEGYSFINWTSDNKEWNFEEDRVFNDVTLKANWSINQYKIDFNTMGGSFIEPQVLDYNSSLSSYIPLKEHCNFEGWYLNEEYKDKIYFVPSRDITIYAKWTEEEQHEIRLFLDGGSYKDNKELDDEYYSIKLFKSDFPLTLEEPKKEENGIIYPFLGWYYDNQFTSKVETLEVGDYSIYAKWDYKRFYSGYYPQSKVDDINLKNELSNLELQDNFSTKIEFKPKAYNEEVFEYVEYEGKKYAKWGSDFFEFQLIEWIKNKDTIYSKYVLDASAWDNSPISKSVFDTSYIDKYLSNVINPILKDNGLAGDVKLLSKYEVDDNGSSGFENNSSKVAYSTDFAKARYNKKYQWETFSSPYFLNNNGACYYWTETINSIYDANLVDIEGKIKQYSNYFVFGVRLALTFDL